MHASECERAMLSAWAFGARDMGMGVLMFMLMRGCGDGHGMSVGMIFWALLGMCMRINQGCGKVLLETLCGTLDHALNM